MKRLLVIVLAAAAGTVVIAMSASSGGAQEPASRTFTLIVRETGGYAAVDNPPKSATKGSSLADRVSSGDLLVGTQPVYDTTGHHLGTLHTSCVASTPADTIGRATYMCTAGYKLASGFIDVAFVRKGLETTNAAVTGGTGKYVGARGAVHSMELGMAPESHGIRLDIDTVTLLP